MAKGSTLGKDPGVTWIFNDWHGGTMTMSRFHKGCYMDLLTAQFNNGHLSLTEVKNVLGNDFAAWGVLSKKFLIDEEGSFFNARLEAEILKRKSYNESRRSNAKGSSAKHMGNGNTLAVPLDLDLRGSKEGETGLQILIREHCPRISLLPQQLTSIEAGNILANFSDDVIKKVVFAMENYKKLNSSYVSVYRTMLNWCDREKEKISNGNYQKAGNGSIVSTFQ